MVKHLFLLTFISASQSDFVNKTLTGILFSTVVRAAVVDKLVILGISPLNSFLF